MEFGKGKAAGLRSFTTLMLGNRADSDEKNAGFPASHYRLRRVRVKMWAKYAAIIPLRGIYIVGAWVQRRFSETICCKNMRGERVDPFVAFNKKSSCTCRAHLLSNSSSN